MDADILIRQETESDFDRIDDVVRSAFSDVEESDHTEHQLVRRLRRSSAYIPGLSLVAVTGGGEVVGHVILSKVEVGSRDAVHAALAVAPLSVLPAWQGRGIGSLLMREAHRRAAAMGYGVALVLGHEGYYPRFGYKRASSFGINSPLTLRTSAVWRPSCWQADWMVCVARCAIRRHSASNDWNFLLNCSLQTYRR